MSDKKKTFAILGDSYSTFLGYVPEDYASWYGVPERFPMTDVRKVEETWWNLVREEAPMTLLTNCSFSGSAVAQNSYESLDPVTSSFLYRMKRELGVLAQQGISPDAILVVAGTNDFWIGTAMGDVKTADWTEEDLKLFAPSYCYMLDYLTKSFPESRILVVVNDAITGENREIQLGLADRYRVDSLLLSDIEKMNGHPDVRGMRAMADQVLAKLQTMGVLQKETE